MLYDYSAGTTQSAVVLYHRGKMCYGLVGMSGVTGIWPMGFQALLEYK